MPDTSDELDHILDVLCDDPALLSTPEERGIAAVGYHNIEEAKAAIINWKNKAIRAEMLALIEESYKPVYYVKNKRPLEWKEQTDFYCKAREDLRRELRQQVISRYGAEDGGDV